VCRILDACYTQCIEEEASPQNEQRAWSEDEESEEEADEESEEPMEDAEAAAAPTGTARQQRKRPRSGRRGAAAAGQPAAGDGAGPSSAAAAAAAAGGDDAGPSTKRRAQVSCDITDCGKVPCLGCAVKCLRAAVLLHWCSVLCAEGHSGGTSSSSCAAPLLAPRLAVLLHTMVLLADTLLLLVCLACRA
jgi:hypothetical protein